MLRTETSVTTTTMRTMMMTMRTKSYRSSATSIPLYRSHLPKAKLHPKARAVTGKMMKMMTTMTETISLIMTLTSENPSKTGCVFSD